MLDDSIHTFAAFSGMEMENMTRNHGWRFLDMGRCLERAQHLIDLLHSLLARGNPEEDGSLVLMLELADSIMTYRSRYLTTPMPPPVMTCCCSTRPTRARSPSSLRRLSITSISCRVTPTNMCVRRSSG